MLNGAITLLQRVTVPALLSGTTIAAYNKLRPNDPLKSKIGLGGLAFAAPWLIGDPATLGFVLSTDISNIMRYVSESIAPQHIPFEIIVKKGVVPTVFANLYLMAGAGIFSYLTHYFIDEIEKKDNKPGMRGAYRLLKMGAFLPFSAVLAATASPMIPIVYLLSDATDYNKVKNEKTSAEAKALTALVIGVSSLYFGAVSMVPFALAGISILGGIGYAVYKHISYNNALNTATQKTLKHQDEFLTTLQNNKDFANLCQVIIGRTHNKSLDDVKRTISSCYEIQGIENLSIEAKKITCIATAIYALEKLISSVDSAEVIGLSNVFSPNLITNDDINLMEEISGCIYQDAKGIDFTKLPMFNRLAEDEQNAVKVMVNNNINELNNSASKYNKQR